MSSADDYLRDVIAHINAFNASGAALAEPDDDPGAADYAVTVDCLVCFGDDPECPWPHGILTDDDGSAPPTLEELEERYGSADESPAVECLACFGGSPECPSPHGDPPAVIWKQLPITALEGDEK